MYKPLPYEVSGNKSATQLLVFLHGWPDTLEVWNKIIPPLEQNHYILNISYPNYSPKEKSPWGISLEETVYRIKATIEEVNETKRTLILIGHDWGAFYAYYIDYHFPGFAAEIITLDVGAFVPILNPFFTIFLFCYQFILITAFLIGGAIGKFITKMVIKFFMYRPFWINKVDASWNYPYYQLWKKLASNKLRVMPNYRPNANVVFVSGDKKPFKIYNKEWAKLLKENPRNELHNEKFIHWIHLKCLNF